VSKQLLIYSKVVPVSSEAHRELSVRVGERFDFAAETNSVPLMVAEFAAAASEYGIVFAGEGERMTPVAILGLGESENLYVARDGSWDARYIPAFIRRYPFVFAASEQGERLTLCIDDAYAGANHEGRGERLFDSEGQQTGYLKQTLAFMQQYQREVVMTRNFCTLLQGLDLLVPMHAQAVGPDGRALRLGGFQAVDRERLKQLPAERLTTLFGSDALELIYLHLHSMQALTRLGARLRDVSVASEESEESAA